MQTTVPGIGHEMQQCVAACLHCYATCRSMAVNHCLPHGGRHVDTDHFRTMLECAELCRAAADLMLISSPLHGELCRVCATSCEACAKSCETLGDMQDCVVACRRCAESCRKMSGGAVR